MDFFQAIDQDLYRKLFPDTNTNLYTTHSFLYYGNWKRTQIHNAFVPGFFLQVANAKRWKFLHKMHAPYISINTKEPENLSSDFVFLDDYPKSHGVPNVEIDLFPGDLLHFGSWHWHEVEDLIPEKLGFAVGLRYASVRNILLGESFISWYLLTLFEALRKADLVMSRRPNTWPVGVRCKQSWFFNGYRVMRSHCVDAEDSAMSCREAELNCHYIDKNSTISGAAIDGWEYSDTDFQHSRFRVIMAQYHLWSPLSYQLGFP